MVRKNYSGATLKNLHRPLMPLAFLFWLYPDKNDINQKPFFKKIIKKIKIAKKHEALKDYESAEKVYHDALIDLYEYEKDGNDKTLEVSQARSYLFDAMADMSIRKKKFDKAEKLYKAVITELLVKQNFPKDDNAILEISLKLAMIYAEQNKNDLAVMGYDYCIKTLENKLGTKNSTEETETKKSNEQEINEEQDEVDLNTQTLYGITLDSYANFLQTLNKVEEALKFFEKALKISLRVLSEYHPQISVIYNSTGVILSKLNKPKEAVEYFEKAIQSGEKSESPNLGVYYLNLAEVQRDLKFEEQALINLKKAHIAASQHPDQKDLVEKINDALKKNK